MKLKLLGVGSLLGLGLGYCAYRSYQKSDGSALGALGQFITDVQTGTEKAMKKGNKIYSAVVPSKGARGTSHAKAGYAKSRGRKSVTRATSRNRHNHASNHAAAH